MDTTKPTIDYILVPSVQHTGTWFLLDILQKAGLQLVPFNCEWTEKNTVLHVHYPSGSGNGILPQEEHKFISLNTLSWAYKHFNNCLVIVPIRDILAALITRQGRHPEYPHKYIIDGFISIAKTFNEFNPFYFPVDLFRTPEEREKLLSNLECIIQRKISFKHITTTNWMPKNTQGEYSLKESYLEGDIEIIKKEIPQEWEYLIKSREILQPFFEGLGYKNLLWYKGADK